MSYIREQSQQDAEEGGVKRAACFKGEDKQCVSAGSQNVKRSAQYGSQLLTSPARTRGTRLS